MPPPRSTTVAPKPLPSPPPPAGPHPQPPPRSRVNQNKHSTEIGSWLTFRVNAHTDARRRGEN